MKEFTIKTLVPLLSIALLIACHASPQRRAAQSEAPVEVTTTTADQSQLLRKQNIGFAKKPDSRHPVIVLDTQQYQPIEGFGYTLTGGSAMLLHQMGAAERTALLQELFGKQANSIGVSYLRLGIGSTDLDPVVYSYCDLPDNFGRPEDPELQHFSIAKDKKHLIPVLKEILAIRPDLTLMGTPWSAPSWMKTNRSSIGGALKPQFFDAYAQYFVKYLRAYQQEGIRIDAVTLQNEPDHDGNNPSMKMGEVSQARLVEALGPALRSAGFDTKIIIWDHNCDNPGFPIKVLNDPEAKPHIHGTAFHLYAGDPSALSEVHAAHPDRALYFTEQWTGAKGSFDGDLQWHVKNVVIGTLRNWSRTALEWNLANDPSFGPHTPGGCTECLGALTLDGDRVTRNVSYYVIAQVAQHVPPGSVRIGSSLPGPLPNVAFRTPTGKTVLIVLNEAPTPQPYNVQTDDGKWISASLPGKAVATLVW